MVIRSICSGEICGSWAARRSWAFLDPGDLALEDPALGPGDPGAGLPGYFLLLFVGGSPGRSPVLISLLIPENPRQKKDQELVLAFLLSLLFS